LALLHPLLLLQKQLSLQFLPLPFVLPLAVIIADRAQRREICRRHGDVRWALIP
jgi:hypothetical protein